MSTLTSEQRKIHNRTYYEKNKEAFRDRATKQQQLLRQYVWEVKQRNPCKHCGESHPAALQFHHRNPAEKDIEIAKAILHGYSLKRLQAEIDKCDIICANCHLKLHYDERNA